MIFWRLEERTETDLSRFLLCISWKQRSRDKFFSSASIQRKASDIFQCTVLFEYFHASHKIGLASPHHLPSRLLQWWCEIYRNFMSRFGYSLCYLCYLLRLASVQNVYLLRCKQQNMIYSFWEFWIRTYIGSLALRTGMNIFNLKSVTSQSLLGGQNRKLSNDFQKNVPGQEGRNDFRSLKSATINYF